MHWSGTTPIFKIFVFYHSHIHFLLLVEPWIIHCISNVLSMVELDKWLIGVVFFFYLINASGYAWLPMVISDDAWLPMVIGVSLCPVILPACLPAYQWLCIVAYIVSDLSIIKLGALGH